MNAAYLLAPWATDAALKAVSLAGMTLDSRQVTSGGLFFAVAGQQRHGLAFLDQALAAGAQVVVYEPSAQIDNAAIAARCVAAQAIAVPVPELSAEVSAIAGRFYDQPGDDLAIIAVTGTDGKTSVAHYTAQLLERWYGQAGLIGTLGWGRVDALKTSTMTTPDPVSVQAQLADLRAMGARSVVMEVSSHALAQQRVEAIPFVTAVLTYIGRDHLDYHGSVAAYQRAKKRLFTWPSLQRQVLNADDAVGRALAARESGPGDRVSYGIAEQADWRLTKLQPSANGFAFDLHTPNGAQAIELPLLGAFNAMNATAASAAVGVEQPLSAVAQALAELRPVPGRMERFIAPGRPLVVVDYAHTPGGLEAALQALRAHTQGRLWCVFGCGGERDRGKRPLMGAIATQLADRVILTSDNPRNEPANEILAEIAGGCAQAGDYQMLEDREAAIAYAVRQAQPGDAVLIAGKGHECEQIIGAQRRALSDRAVVADLLARRAS